MRMPHRGYILAISTHAECHGGSLFATELHVLDPHGVDVTPELFFEYAGSVPATGETLKEALEAIEDLADSTC